MAQKILRKGFTKSSTIAFEYGVVTSTLPGERCKFDRMTLIKVRAK